MFTWLTPKNFQNIAIMFHDYRWRCMGLCVAMLALFLFLEPFVTKNTPDYLLALLFFILFSALQCLIFAAFIFFFYQLPSDKTTMTSWQKFYRIIEKSEVYLFAVILPFPTLIFIYGVFHFFF